VLLLLLLLFHVTGVSDSVAVCNLWSNSRFGKSDFASRQGIGTDTTAVSALSA
jgi:hypothetical protein